VSVAPILASTTVDLARAQFATTSIYHFLFVPLTLGLAPLVASMQTLWRRTGDEEWLRLTRFFGTLLLINFAIGVATGLVQEFQFGMNWSVYSQYVGGVFGAPLAIEGLAAFFLEAVFLGVWIFGWDRISPRLHLASIWLAALGTWLSAYFILVANSWMQHPVGYKVVDGKAQLTDVGALLSNNFAVHAFLHTILAGFTTAALVILGVACWHFLRGRNVALFRKAAALALVVAVPVTFVNLLVGSNFGITTTTDQPMKIAAAEALWNSEKPASFSLFQIGGFSQQSPKPSFSIDVPDLLSFLSTGSFTSEVKGLNQLQQQAQREHGPGSYTPPVRAIYWSMRVMAYLGALMFLLSALGAWLYRKGRLETTRWFQKSAIVAIAFPFLAMTAGWVLTEVGRQPWIVQGLLKTAQANSPSVSGAMIGVSLAVFVALYITLGVTDFVLMRRYARLDPPEVGSGSSTHPAPEPATPVPAIGY
jgi:cytochrome bd ubiquinol oxidase subunit I